MCVRNAGRQERNIRDRLKIGKESKGEKETGKWREKKKHKYNYEKMEKNNGAQRELKKDRVCKLFIHKIQKLWPNRSLQFL